MWINFIDGRTRALCSIFTETDIISYKEHEGEHISAKHKTVYMCSWETRIMYIS